MLTAKGEKTMQRYVEVAIALILFGTAAFLGVQELIYWIKYRRMMRK